MMEELVKRLPFWSSLTEEEKHTVETSALLRRFPAGSYLHGNSGESESCFGMMLILSGQVRAFILSEEGREITLFRLGEGESCVLSASCVISQIRFETLLTVSRDAELLVLPAVVFSELTEKNIYVRCYLYEATTERFSQVMWVLQDLLFSRFDTRLAKFLLHCYRESGSRELRMTQQEIAENVNSAREVVARMLKQFAAEGMVENRRGMIVLKDIPALERLL